jgi:hypothetical protein
MHDPDHAAAVAEARRIGGHRRRREATIDVVFDLEDLRVPEGRWRLLDIAVREALHLENSLPRVRVLLLAVSTAGRLAAAGLEERVTRLERQAGFDPPAHTDTGSVLDEEPDEPA